MTTLRVPRFGTLVLAMIAAAPGLRSETRDTNGREPGLAGIVFDNPALAKPVRVWTVPEPRSEHLAPIARHDFSLALRGRLDVPSAREVEIRAEADGGIRLRLDDVTVIDGWASGGAREGRARAGDGGALAFELDYFHDGGVPVLALAWRQAGATRWTPIPAAAFSTTVADRAAVASRFSDLMREYEKVVAGAANPHPELWPTLQFVQQGVRPLLRIRFPDVPDFTCDAWMYESEMDMLGARDLGEGRMEVRHRLRAAPGVVIVSVVVPEPGAVEITAQTMHEDGSAAALPEGTPPPGLCWQLRKAPSFAAHPEPYARFAERCFVFTERGLTRLDRTSRVPSARFPADDPVNNPPWVQAYLPSWAVDPVTLPFPWAGVSPDRIAATVAGVVSRDGRHLAAIANDSATSISQVWIDCLHNNPEWRRAEDGAGSEWRLKIYVLPNDPDALLRRVAADFPGIRVQPAFRELVPEAPAH